jgi:hypothetical protein
MCLECVQAAQPLRSRHGAHPSPFPPSRFPSDVTSLLHRHQQSRTEGYRATGTGNNRNLIAAFRAIASASAAYTIWALRGKPTPNY